MANEEGGVVVALRENGTWSIKPGMTVGQLLQIAEALRTLALGVQLSPTQPPAEPIK